MLDSVISMTILDLKIGCLGEGGGREFLRVVHTA
jgi:hypothetical protein